MVKFYRILLKSVQIYRNQRKFYKIFKPFALTDLYNKRLCAIDIYVGLFHQRRLNDF